MANTHPALSVDSDDHELRRGLKARHIQMIALGGTIGTGLFLASGRAISNGGPGGALVAYAVLGILVYCVMMSMGEMAAYIPVAGSFAHFASRFSDPSLGFCVGWVYWANWAVGVAVQVTGVAMLMEFWLPDFPSYVWSIICLVILIGFNVFAVKGYGEIEYWLSAIKILTVIIFIIVGFCVVTGTAGGNEIGNRNFHLEGGAFPNGFLGFFNVLVTAAFSFNGVEIVGIAAGESENPHKTVPTAVNQVFYRIVVFYMMCILVIGLCIPYTDPDLLRGNDDISVSPFTLVFRLAGAEWAAHLMNAIILTTMISAGNSGVYSSSRTLLAMAENGSAPRFFTRLNRWGVPLCCLIGCLAFLTSLFSSGVVFNWLTNLTSVAGLVTWVSISITHIRFRIGYRRQKLPLDQLPYKSPLFPFLDLFVIVIGTIIIFGQGYHTFLDPIDGADVVAAYIGLIFAVVIYVGHKVIMRPAFVKSLDMDFVTGTIPIDHNKAEQEKKLPLKKRIWKTFLTYVI
ncbi:amino acid permease/ SLC12A domain-containing protein [Zychaea mexicana]|uniref:amino acid permease/ SLC12A domain-containing protein n=1 Tax=Zychaea mexicana TaxID=64656 RepID=UPI0022FE7DDC|nr:amino acid permease/ SLC12A domain-containing protein [Zychaea mexicana]KAI9493285.1 amino acid permease/ SLC12A domain-containing protein [Zychaea mexicana]